MALTLGTARVFSQATPFSCRRAGGQQWKQDGADVQPPAVVNGDLIHADSPGLKVKSFAGDARPCPQDGHT